MVFMRTLLLFIILASNILVNHQTYSKDDRQTYIVYMGDHPKGIDPASLPSHHMTMAKNVLGSGIAPEAILHSYWRSFNGFVIKLTEQEAKTMEGMDNVVSVFRSRKSKPHTTRFWDFIGFPQEVKRTALERDIIVGVIDSGIWPESQSFTDQGLDPPPSTWKGSCDAHNFTCNKKIIGARYYRRGREFLNEDIISPRDTSGHGTHCASTIAGNLVSSASLLGLGSGTARGGTPSARVAVYKVCWSNHKRSCLDEDVLAAFDDAISDGVDIISMSLGKRYVASNYFKDPYAIGAFHAMRKGILTSNSAGNEGPGLFTMSTFAPWLLSVAATTIDRKFSTKLQLGNGLVFEGVSVNTFDLQNKSYPLIFAGDAPNTLDGYDESDSRFCLSNSLNKALVKGKIILCDYGYGELELPFEAAGAVLASTRSKDTASIYSLPAIHISYKDSSHIRTYLSSTSNPTATILRTSEEKDSFAPYAASFSSRGPNPFTPSILKPDVGAPGVDIVAAWSPISPVSGVKGDKRQVHYNIMSGTSMACPHATAAAAYVKSFHPTWSPSAIKSALMTTAVPLSAALNPEAEFAYGAGQINPLMAMNPGLVYDASEIDYVRFLCAQGYEKHLQTITGDSSTCTEAKKQGVWDLNLASFAYYTNFSTPFSTTFHRTVTNVGSPNSIYRAKVIAPPVLSIQVSPEILNFSSLAESKMFTVTVEGLINVDIVSASLVWDDGNFQVRSPIVVYSHRIAYKPKNQEMDA